MSRTLCFAALTLAVLAVPAAAASAFDVPRPPVVLSPDLTDPWVLQLRPGHRAIFADPALRQTAFAPGVGAIAPRAAPQSRDIDPAYLPTFVDYATDQPEGTIVIDTEARYLYLVLGGGKAKRYGVGVGRPGFEWAGLHTISRMAEWPDWTPPVEMRHRQPGLPVSMKGGTGNPLGARALYLGSSLYRIHGSNEPWTIGHAVSSGCIRMRNEDVIDLYGRVKVGTRVIVI
jgi:lipoprotein-anchoring transpeptidase ErfK/SrfK